MVITAFLKPSWTVTVTAVTVLCVAVMFLLCCLCQPKKRNESLKIGDSTRKFLNFSNNSLNKLMTFRSFNSSRDESTLATHDGDPLGSDSDLLDNGDLFKGFTSSRLKIDRLDDDVESCNSNDSKFTFYSTYPGIPRSGSNTSDTATYKSTRTSLAKIPSTGSNKIIVV